MDKNNTYQARNQSLHIIDDRSEKNKESDDLDYIFNFYLSSGNSKINVCKNWENEVQNKLNIIEKMPNEKVLSQTEKKNLRKILRNSIILDPI